jgi:alpha-tubulin suppressor-like RCC1 family protein
MFLVTTFFNYRKRPTKISFFDNLADDDRVVQIAVGANHSLALTSSGKLYSWGFGESAQLGHGLSSSCTSLSLSLSLLFSLSPTSFSFY